MPARPSQIWGGRVCLERGHTYIIEAASGTGKSSLCAYIYGARRDYEGSILFDGADTASFTIDRWQRLRREALAYVPQELDLFPELTAMQNIELKRRLTDFTPRRRAEEWLGALGLADRRDFPAGRMSIGQQQRLALVRALCQPFSFLLLDEPVSHLDAANNAIVSEIVAEEARRQGAAVIATSVGVKPMFHSPTLLQL